MKNHRSSVPVLICLYDVKVRIGSYFLGVLSIQKWFISPFHRQVSPAFSCTWSLLLLKKKEIKSEIALCLKQLAKKR